MNIKKRSFPRISTLLPGQVSSQAVIKVPVKIKGGESLTGTSTYEPHLWNKVGLHQGQNIHI